MRTQFTKHNRALRTVAISATSNTTQNRRNVKRRRNIVWTLPSMKCWHQRRKSFWSYSINIFPRNVKLVIAACLISQHHKAHNKILSTEIPSVINPNALNGDCEKVQWFNNKRPKILYRKLCYRLKTRINPAVIQVSGKCMQPLSMAYWKRENTISAMEHSQTC